MYHLKESTVSSHPLEIEFAKQLGKCYFKEFQSASMQHPNHNIAFPRQQRNIGRVLFFPFFQIRPLSLSSPPTYGPISRRLESHAAAVGRRCPNSNTGWEKVT